MKDDKYYFHQTPQELCIELLKQFNFKDGDNVLEPFKGEGGFYNNLPNNINKYYTEIEEGIDYKDFDKKEKKINYVISNPPFRMEINNKRINSFYTTLKYFIDLDIDNIAYLGNDRCLASLTPLRLQYLKEKGYYINKIITCNITKWRGRYYFIIINKNKNDFYDFINKNF